MKRMVIICIAQMLGMMVMAQNSIAELFKVMPDSVMPVLTKNNRLDLIDFMEAKMKAEVTNLLDGDTEMTFLSEDSLSIRMNSALRIDLFLVSTEQPYDSCHQVVCMRSTYRLATTSEEEQVLQYYSIGWHPISEPKLSVPLVPVSCILRQDVEVFKKE